MNWDRNVGIRTVKAWQAPNKETLHSPKPLHNDEPRMPALLPPRQVSVDTSWRTAFNVNR